MKKHSISIEDFKEAQKKINPWIFKTPLNFSRTLSSLSGIDVYLKMENEQITGSFKIRGALNKVFNLSESERKRGFISCSAGNHAQGVAYAAKCIKGSALIVLPESTPIVKEEAVRNYGADIVMEGRVYDESYSKALQLCQETGRIFIHAYEDPLIITGQGSIGLEIIEQLSDVDSVIVPLGGGGLVSGIAALIKQIKPSCKVYAVVSALAPAMERFFHQKSYHPGKDFKGPGLADGITLKKASRKMFEEYISKYVDDIISVEENDIASAMVLLLERGKTLVEGSGATTVAALLKQHKIWNLGQKCILVLSGGNVDLNTLSNTIETGLKAKGRLSRLSVMVKDEPGALNKITAMLFRLKSNILAVYHNRHSPELSQGYVRIDIVVETRGEKHLKEICLKLKKQAYTVTGS